MIYHFCSDSLVTEVTAMSWTEDFTLCQTDSCNKIVFDAKHQPQNINKTFCTYFWGLVFMFTLERVFWDNTPSDKFMINLWNCTNSSYVSWVRTYKASPTRVLRCRSEWKLHNCIWRNKRATKFGTFFMRNSTMAYIA